MLIFEPPTIAMVEVYSYLATRLNKEYSEYER